MHEHVYVYRYIYTCILLIYKYKWIQQRVCVNEYVNMLVLGHGNVCVFFCEWMWFCLCVTKCVFTCVEVIMWVCLCATVSEYMSICVWEIVCMNMNMILSKCECVIMSRSQHEWFCSVCVNTHVCVYEHAGCVNKWTCSCVWNWSYMSDSCVSMLSVK